MAVLSFVSCKKDNISSPRDDGKYIDGNIRVLSVGGTDTFSTPLITPTHGGRVASTESIALAVDEDDKMRAELLSYQPLGGGKALYIVNAINKTDCQQLVRWHWIGGLLVDSIIPLDDAVYPHSATIFKVYGTATVGAITLNAQAHEPTSCGNSRTLQLSITTAILPSTIKQVTAERTGDKMTVKFHTENPQASDHFVIMWTPDGDLKHEIVIDRIPCNGITKDYTYQFLAMTYKG